VLKADSSGAVLFSDKVLVLRSRLKRKYELLLMHHLPFAVAHGVDRQLWKAAFYTTIERCRKLLRPPSDPALAVCQSFTFPDLPPRLFALTMSTGGS
jgi:hypothetical protein